MEIRGQGCLLIYNAQQKKGVALAFGKIIQKWRISRDLTPAKLENQCQLDRTYISMIENGKKHATIKTIFLLCGVFKIPPSDIVMQSERELKSTNRNRGPLSFKKL
ncbi:MAG: helix-turn-helix transcriptional regulator [Bdellovibrionaceae bacterium]|nr:helix-turn-helix transcriptional regulator [Bdellovibrio sp.]